MSDTIDKRRRQDFEDQQNELAGRDTGRMARFGVGSARLLAEKEEARKERAYLDALERLLATDPEYRALYEELGVALSAAEREADTAIRMIQDQVQLAEQEIADMENTAARDPDGRPVFRHADGRVVYVDGSEVPTAIADGIVWPADAPSAEEFFAAKARRDELRSQLEEWLTYRNDVLGHTRDRYDDRDNPMTKSELQKALEQIEEAIPSLKTIETPPPGNNVVDATPVSELSLPSQLR